MALTRDEILQAADTKFIEVEVPEWGGSVKLASMSGKARDAFETSILNKTGGVNTVNLRAKLVAASIVDNNGNLIFGDSDIEALGKKSYLALDRVFNEAQKLNAIGQKEVEELAKN